MKGSDDVLLCIKSGGHARPGLFEIITFLKVGEGQTVRHRLQRLSFCRGLGGPGSRGQRLEGLLGLGMGLRRGNVSGHVGWGILVRPDPVGRGPGTV
eukprot:gene11093-biopygen15867